MAVADKRLSAAEETSNAEPSVAKGCFCWMVCHGVLPNAKPSPGDAPKVAVGVGALPVAVGVGAVPLFVGVGAVPLPVAADELLVAVGVGAVALVDVGVGATAPVETGVGAVVSGQTVRAVSMYLDILRMRWPKRMTYNQQKKPLTGIS